MNADENRALEMVLRDFKDRITALTERVDRLEGTVFGYINYTPKKEPNK